MRAASEPEMPMQETRPRQRESRKSRKAVLPSREDSPANKNARPADNPVEPGCDNMPLGRLIGKPVTGTWDYLGHEFPRNTEPNFGLPLGRHFPITCCGA